VPRAQPSPDSDAAGHLAADVLQRASRRARNLRGRRVMGAAAGWLLAHTRAAGGSNGWTGQRTWELPPHQLTTAPHALPAQPPPTSPPPPHLLVAVVQQVGQQDEAAVPADDLDGLHLGGQVVHRPRRPQHHLHGEEGAGSLAGRRMVGGCPCAMLSCVQLSTQSA